jgi:hypothetical protein
MATLIPVLFLALSLQGDFLMKSLLAARHWRQSLRDAYGTWIVKRSPWQRHVADPFVRNLENLFFLVPGLILIYGLFGEIEALLALERGSASADLQSTVMQAGVVMTCAVVLAFLVRYTETIIASHVEAAKKKAALEEPPE